MAKASMMNARAVAPRPTTKTVDLSGWANFYKFNDSDPRDPTYTIGPCIYSTEAKAKKHVSLENYAGRRRTHVATKPVSFSDTIQA